MKFYDTSVDFSDLIRWGRLADWVVPGIGLPKQLLCALYHFTITDLNRKKCCLAVLDLNLKI